MLAIGGLAIVFACVFGVYAMTGGNVALVLEALPHEMATIGGAAAGTFLVSNSSHVIKHTLKDIKKVFGGARFRKDDYLDLLCLMFQLLKLARTKGVIALEGHIEKPEESSAFRNFPKILADHVAVGLLCDYLRLVSMNQDDPHQIDDVMAREIKQYHQSEM